MFSIKISIITATLNSANNLESLFKSVIPHISNKIEFIIIDGKSEDGTLEIIKKYSHFLSHWESSSDGGIYEAFNKGIKAAKGEFISFVGSDDILLENYSEAYLGSILNNPDCNYFSSKAILKNKEVGKNFSWKELAMGMKVIHPGSLHKRILFDNDRFFNTSYKIASDYDFLIKCGTLINNYFIDQPTIIIGPNGVSNLNYGLALKEEFQIKNKNNLNNYFINLIYLYYTKIKIKIKKIIFNIF
jgi:glycosyltransferase involved in cell wall biosynthesis